MEINEPQDHNSKKTNILSIALSIFGLLIIFGASLFWSFMVQLGKGMATTGCSGDCSMKLDDWMSEEALFFAWLPIAFGILCLVGAWWYSKE